jgi:hypothetical protein
MDPCPDQCTPPRMRTCAEQYCSSDLMLDCFQRFAQSAWCLDANVTIGSPASTQCNLLLHMSGLSAQLHFVPCSGCAVFTCTLHRRTSADHQLLLHRSGFPTCGRAQRLCSLLMKPRSTYTQGITGFGLYRTRQLQCRQHLPLRPLSPKGTRARQLMINTSTSTWLQLTLQCRLLTWY